MANGVPFLSPKVQFTTNDGEPLAAGTIDVYEPGAGTTARRSVYQDADLSTPHLNPLTLDAYGRATIYMDPTLSYKIVVKDSSGSTIYAEDNVPGSVVTMLPISSSIWTGAVRQAAATAENVFGGARQVGRFLRITGSYSPANATAGVVASLYVDQILAVPANANGYVVGLTGTLSGAASGTHALLATLALGEPTINLGGSTITTACTLYVNGAPASSGTNYAIYVPSGACSFGGVVAVGYHAGFSWNTKVKNTTYTVDSDCIVVVYARENGTTSCTIEFKTDSASPPTTVRGGMDIGTGAGYLRANTITVPVRRGDRFRVDESALVGSAPTYTISSVPLGGSSAGGV